MYERRKPSTILIILSLIPPILIFSVFMLTDWFNVKPRLPMMFYAILPLILMVISTLISALSYLTAKDEEPEWGTVLPYKIIEGVNLAYAVISVMLIALVVVMYFIPS